MESDGDMSMIVFRHCIIKQLEVTIDVSLKMRPKFHECIIGKVYGPKSAKDLGDRMFECEVGAFEASGLTTSALLDNKMPLPMKVLSTIVKKIFFQAGAARQISALYRGLDNDERTYVDPIINILQGDGVVAFATAGGRQLAVPNRRFSAEMRSVMFDPMGSESAIVAKVRAL